MLLLAAGMLPVASAKQPVVAGASSPGSWRALLLAAGAVVLCCLVLTQVAAVAPWRPITAPIAWQLHANRSEQQAASLAAQPLEQLQQRQQQQQLEEQQRWKELKQQHDQQTQALSAVQQVQQEVHAGVQKLQQEFGNLVNSTLTSVAQHMPSSAQQEAGNTTHQGVICTVLRNEAKYVPEWVAFHLLLGATKVVIYDDNSTDALKEATAPFGDSVAVINMYKDVTGVPGDNSVHRVGARQGALKQLKPLLVAASAPSCSRRKGAECVVCLLLSCRSSYRTNRCLALCWLPSQMSAVPSRADCVVCLLLCMCQFHASKLAEDDVSHVLNSPCPRMMRCTAEGHSLWKHVQHVPAAQISKHLQQMTLQSLKPHSTLRKA
jgi:hypothetical protein